MSRATAPSLLACLLAAAALPAAGAGSATAPEGRPTVYALVSAVGGQFSFVRRRMQVGTNLEPYHRVTAAVAGAGLDGAVLRGLERVVVENDPGSERVFVRLNPLELEGVLPQDRKHVAIGKLLSALAAFPGRSGWDKIIAVTPNYVRAEHGGMGAKLHGIGVFVQPLEGPRAGVGESLDLGIAPHLDPETKSPEGEASRSQVYVAPYFYTQVWVIDARTLQVQETDERFDHQKIWDPAWTAIDVQRNLAPEELARHVDRFVERTSARALRETLGVVRVTDPKPVSPTAYPESQR